jgi:ABC-type transport system involved in multi-copper enzyme maturation permease subunit
VSTFFLAVIGTQLTLVLLAAPAATAGAICLDRARGTLTHLMVTDLSDGEIVLGKLAARLVPVLGLVGCALPLMAILTLLGGVDPDALLGAFLVTLGVAVLGCSLALVFSLWAGKTHEALLGTYAVWGLWLLGRPMLSLLGGLYGVSLWLPPRTFDPFSLAFAAYLWPGSVGRGDYLWFVGVTWSLSAVLTAVAVLRLRAVCTRDRARPKGVRLLRSWPHLPRLPGPTLDFNPVLWREWHRDRPSRWAKAIGLLFFGLAATFSATAVVLGSGGESVGVNGFQVAIGLLLLSVTASTSLAEERVRGSLDVLMTTPLSTRQIVLGKWLGTFRSVPPLVILPGLVILGGARGDVWRWQGIALMVAYIIAAGAAVTGLGLASATWCSRLGRAVGLTVTAYVLMTVGWVFLVIALINPHPSGIGVVAGSPFYGAVLITLEYCERGFGEHHTGWIIFWIIAHAVAALAFLVATLASFNRCLGRVEIGLTGSEDRGWGPVGPAKDEKGEDIEFAGR